MDYGKIVSRLLTAHYKTVMAQKRLMVAEQEAADTWKQIKETSPNGEFPHDQVVYAKLAGNLYKIVFDKDGLPPAVENVAHDFMIDFDAEPGT